MRQIYKNNKWIAKRFLYFLKSESFIYNNMTAGVQ